MKVSELEGAELNYWVAKAEGHSASQIAFQDGGYYFPSKNWEQGGPIIERERIDLSHNYASFRDGSEGWAAWCMDKDGFPVRSDGPTLLIAAMRAYVASRFGEEVPQDKEAA